MPPPRARAAPTRRDAAPSREPVELFRDNLTVVRRVFQEPPGRYVGERELLPSVDPASPLAAALSREARVLSRLEHPGVVGLLDLTESTGGPMRLRFDDPGLTVAAWMASSRAAQPAARPDERPLLALGLLLARALGHAHEAGVVHAHVRPACVGLGSSGRVRLFDFARAVVDGEGPPPAHGLPLEQGPVAPELRRDLPTPATDVFGVGVLLYELCALGPPVGSPHALTALPPSLRGSPLEAVLRRSLAPDPSARFADGGALAEHLARLVGGDDDARAAVRALLDPARAAPEPPPSVAPPPRGPLVPLVGLSAIMLGGLVALDLLWRAPPPAAEGGPPLGSVRVLARPWADVRVDGRRVDTTPIGRPLVLTAGRHDLLFTHPTAPDERRTVEVRAGETLTVKVEMQVVRPAAPRPSASAEEQP